MQKERDQVLEVYRSVGLDKAKDFTEPDDHVAVELHFMSYLAGETSSAAGTRDRKRALELLHLQQRFLKEHLGRWIGSLADDVVKQAKASFYKGVSLMAAGFIEEDSKVLVDFIEELEGTQ